MFNEIHMKILTWGTTKINQSDKAKEEKKALMNKNCIVLLPEQTFKKIWNFVIIILLVYTAIYVPVQTSFIDEDSAFMQNFEIFIDILFISDLLVNFISAFEDIDTGFLEV